MQYGRDLPKLGASRAGGSAVLVAECERRFAEHSRADWVARLRGSECIWGLNQTPSDIPDDPQVRANGYIMDIARRDGTTFRAVGAPVQFDGQAATARHAAQDIGEETEAVLRAAGVDAATLAAARAAGAIGGSARGTARA